MRGAGEATANVHIILQRSLVCPPSCYLYCQRHKSACVVGSCMPERRTVFHGVQENRMA